jgi:hypothetical protein
LSDERDRVLTEAMGECWHDYDLGQPVFTCKGGGFVCRECGDFLISNNCFVTDEDFRKLWTWAGRQERLAAVFRRYASESPGAPPEGREARERFADELFALYRNGIEASE